MGKSYMMKKLTYVYNYIEECNMCHADSTMQKKIGRRMNTSNGFNPRRRIGISTTVMKCKNCGLIYSNPQPIPLDLSMHYDMPVTEYYSGYFLNVAEEGLQYKGELDFVRIFKEHYKGIGKPKVLDLGCGIGSTLSKYQKEGFDIYGLEPSHTFFEKSKEYLGEDFRKVQNVPFEKADYSAEQFDFIYSFNVLEHVYDPNEMIVQALKWLKPGGLFGLIMPSSAWLTSKIYNFYYGLRGTDLVTNISPMHNPFHLYEFGKKSFFENARINNYKIHKINVVATDTHLPKFLDFILLPIMRATSTGLRLEVIIQKS
jgi:SAM-dependent methyltransferase